MLRSPHAVHCKSPTIEWQSVLRQPVPVKEPSRAKLASRKSSRKSCIVLRLQQCGVGVIWIRWWCAQRVCSSTSSCAFLCLLYCWGQTSRAIMVDDFSSHLRRESTAGRTHSVIATVKKQAGTVACSRCVQPSSQQAPSSVSANSPEKAVMTNSLDNSSGVSILAPKTLLVSISLLVLGRICCGRVG